jgi:hypothetical protein
MKSAVSSSPAGSRSARAALVLAVAICLGAVLPARAQMGPTIVQRITSSVVGGEAVITIEANGPLPAPTIGTVDGPPRIFLDFPGVRTSTSGLARAADRRIVRVRAAINSVTPLITRVVLDLTAPQPHRIEQATGRVMIFVGATTLQAVPPLPRQAAGVDPPPASAAPARRAAAPRNAPSSATAAARPPARTSGWPAATAEGTSEAAPSPPPASPPVDATNVGAPPAGMTPPPIALVPPLPDPPPPSKTAAAAPGSSRAPALPDTAGGGTSGRRTHRPPTAAPPSKDVERYRSSVSPLLLRLRMQQPLLESLGSLEAQVPSVLQSAIEEFDNVRQELSAVRPPETLKQQHELLMQATRLGMTAARLSVESIKPRDSAVVRNAASAAAGAILMLDRACADLGCPGPPGR